MTESSVHCAPYLRKSYIPYIPHSIVIYGAYLWNDNASRGGGGGRGGRGGGEGEKTTQNDQKFCMSHLVFQESYIIWYLFLVHMHKRIFQEFQEVFPFFQNFDFRDHSVSQEPYIIRLRFLVHICKMMTSPPIFSIFSKFWFFGFLGREGGKRAKNDLKWPISVCQALYLRNCRSHHQEIWYAVVK